MSSNFESIIKTSPNEHKQSIYIEHYEKHLAALVKFGYFSYKRFYLENIQIPSPEAQKLLSVLQETFPDIGHEYHFVAQGYEPETPDVIIVWDCPDNIVKWEKIIFEHDKSSQNTKE